MIGKSKYNGYGYQATQPCIQATRQWREGKQRGHASPEGFWYDQEKDEFILVVKGSAGLKLENEDAIVVLKAGDYFNIGAHVKHRVEWTDSTCETIWLAVHY